MKSWLKPGSAFNDQEAMRPLRLEVVLPAFILVVLMWLVYYLDIKWGLDLYQLGIYPRHWKGLPGLFTSPLVHGSGKHLSNNSIPLLVLGSALYYFYPKRASTVLWVSWLGSGLTVWLVARESYHIGASGIIYALAGFIFLSGVLRGKANLLAMSLLVVFVYGGLVWGVLPIEEQVSYEAHAAGAASGFALAIIFRKTRPTEGLPEYQTPLPEQEDDLTEQIAKYGEDYWKNDSAEKKSIIVYHYKTRQNPPE